MKGEKLYSLYNNEGQLKRQQRIIWTGRVYLVELLALTENWNKEGLTSQKHIEL